MPGDDCPPEKRDWKWLTSFDTPLVPEGTIEHSFVASTIRRCMPHARAIRVERVQHRGLWRRYMRYRDEELRVLNDGDANEHHLFHGTGAQPPLEVLGHQDGLDPKLSGGGFYGSRVYLAESPAYPVGGRYAHRVHGSGGGRMQLLMVRAAVGMPQELGTQVDKETRAMKLPGKRPDGRLFDCVRVGPHRPFVSGPGVVGKGGSDASIIYVVYRPEQMYPEYVITMDVPMPAVDGGAHAVISLSEVEANTPPSKRARCSTARVAPTVSNAPAVGAASPQPPGAASSGKINVEVRAEDLCGIVTTEFLMRLRTQFAKMMFSWTSHHEIRRDDASFFAADGRELLPEDTPESVGWSLAPGQVFVVWAKPREGGSSYSTGLIVPK